jgi:hypothetical protein
MILMFLLLVSYLDVYHTVFDMLTYGWGTFLFKGPALQWSYNTLFLSGLKYSNTKQAVKD